MMRYGGLLLVGLAGCIDFVEPELPDRGAPAVLQLTVLLTEPDAVEIEGRLVPGLDAAGVPRRVTDARIRVFDRTLDPDSVSGAGTRVYRAGWTRTGAGPVEVNGPAIEGLAAAPAFRWFGVRRAGPPVLELRPGADLPLPVAADSGTAFPEPEIRQWFLTLTGRDQVFRLGADGPPPPEIRVPARWVPEGDTVAVRLIYQQSSKIEVPGGYVGLVTLDVRTAWTAWRAENASRGR